ncbi:MAG: hypothetical protein ACPLSJ_03640 [Thermosulfidibacteraceae bacterium]
MEELKNSEFKKENVLEEKVEGTKLDKFTNVGESRDSSADRRLIWGAIVFAIIALIMSVFGLISVRKLMDVEEDVKKLEKNVSYTKHKFTILTSLERIYTLTMVDRDYDAAKKELVLLKAEYGAIKDSLSDEERKKVDSVIGELENEINRGPSPIPRLVNELRTLFSTKELPSTQSKK